VVLGGADSASAAGPQLSSFTGLPATATVPPLPPGPPSGVFTPFSPSEPAAAAAAWAATLQTRDPAYGIPDDIAYQGPWRLLVPIRRYQFPGKSQDRLRSSAAIRALHSVTHISSLIMLIADVRMLVEAAPCGSLSESPLVQDPDHGSLLTHRSPLRVLPARDQSSHRTQTTRTPAASAAATPVGESSKAIVFAGSRRHRSSARR